MDISSLGIPNIRTTKVGSGRSRIEIVEAVVRLEAWDGYLVKRWEYPTTIWEKPRAIADGTGFNRQLKIDNGKLSINPVVPCLFLCFLWF